MNLLLKRTNILITFVLCFSTQLLTSCMSQPPAPIEFKSGVLKNDTSKYAISEEDSEIITTDIKEIPSQNAPKKYFIDDQGIPEEDRTPLKQTEENRNDVPTPTYKESTNSMQKENEAKLDAPKNATNKQTPKEPDQSLDDKLNAMFADSNKGAQPSVVKEAPVNAVAKEAPVNNVAQNIPEGLSNSLAKPIEGNVIKTFDSANQGINIAADLGTPVQSISDGQVVYSGYDSKFGNLVITKLNEGDFYAAFAHLDDLSVVKGQKLAQGEIIGHVGQTGASDVPQLYMALKKGKVAIDPMPYLNY